MTALLAFIVVLFLLMVTLGQAFKHDLDDLEKTNPQFRKQLKDKFKI